MTRLLRKLWLFVEASQYGLTASAILQVEIWQEYSNESSLARYLFVIRKSLWNNFVLIKLWGFTNAHKG